jgi:predicted permease
MTVLLRDALRSIRSTPLLTAAAVLSFALGIGANTAIFTLLNSLLLKPLPVSAPEELIALTTPSNPNEAIPLSYPVWKEIRDRRLLDRPFAWAADRVSVSDTGEVGFADAIWATGEFFDALGIDAVRGRTFGPRDDRRDGGPDGPVAVLSFGAWQRQFGGAPDIVGRRLTIERVPFTIVGVTPPEFLGVNVGTTFDLILPLEVEPRLGRPTKRVESPTWTWLQVMARRAPGQPIDGLSRTLGAARSEIRDATMPAFPRAEDRERYLNAPWEARAAPGGVSRMRRQYSAALWVLLAVVSVVLLIACANVATLLLERAAGRRYEFSVRLSLGATRGRLVRQLLLETLLISIGAAAAGLLLSQWAARGLVAQLSTWAYAAAFDLSIDWRVLATATLVTMLVAVVTGIAPALHASRAHPVDALVQRTRWAIGDRRIGGGAVLVIAQVALSLVLVVAAGLFLQSFVALAYRDLGFDRDRVLIAVVDAGRSATPPAARLALYGRLREAVSALPDVEAAAISTATPLGSAGVRFTPAFTVPGQAMPPDGVRILTNPVSTAWFKTFGTRLLAGRDFDDADRPGSRPVVVVNEAFADRYFRGRNPVGETIAEIVSPDERRSLQIVGLVQNAAFASVRDPIEPTMYAPLEQRLKAQPLSFMPALTISVRSRPGSSSSSRSAIAAAMAGVDPNLAISFQTVSEQLNVFYIRERLLAWLSGFFGAFALVLAALGLYASISNSVVRRRAEIGIRLALGAQTGAVQRMVLRRVTMLVTVGLVIGAIGSWWAARLVASLLYDIPARDPNTVALASLVMLIAAGAAGWLPARRAARVDPAVVLREG